MIFVRLPGDRSGADSLDEKGIRSTDDKIRLDSVKTTGRTDASRALGRDVSLSAWVSFCCGWRWRGRMVLPRRHMDFRACYCATLGSPFLERPIPAKVNQASNNNYFNQQSHTKGEICRRSWAHAILIFVWELASFAGTRLRFNVNHWY